MTSIEEQLPSPDYPSLPRQTGKIVHKYTNRCQNVSLLLDKYIPRKVIEQPAEKACWFNQIAHTNVDENLIQQLHNRWSHMIGSLAATARFQAEIEWRMIVGLGGKTVLETDITLHHLYGIPYIPASALKGLTRAYAARQTDYFVSPNTEGDKIVESVKRPAPNAEMDHPDIQRIFGSQKMAGTVRFFDAMLVPKILPGQHTFTLQCDIMTPHYAKYYASLSSDNIHVPTNNDNPNPIPYLTLANATFDFALAPRDANKAEHRDDVTKAHAWLLKALQDNGIGGKTSSGYGYLKEVESVGVKAESLAPWQRPNNLADYQEDDLLPPIGKVIKPDEQMSQDFPRATSFLRFGEFSASAVLIVIEDDFAETQSWHPGDSNKKCIFLREELHGSRLIWFCKPAPRKNKNKDKARK